MILAVDFNPGEVRFWACEDAEKFLPARCCVRGAAALTDDAAVESCVRSIAGGKKPEAISFRVLFAGDCFKGPALVTGSFFTAFQKLTVFFPFYVPGMLEMLRRFKRIFKDIPLLVFFETSFFRKLPESARFYAMPSGCCQNSGVKKWGFHGIFHEQNAMRFLPREKTVSVVIDNQTTVCAVKDRRPFSISLGYTPLEGVMSRTSCGDIDPGIVFYLMHAGGFSIYQIDEILKNESGFKGLTGYDIELEDMLKLRGKDTAVDLAFDVYQSQLLRHIGDGIAAVGGIDNLVFSGCRADAFRPVIYELIKKMAFLGITPARLPWKVEGETVLASDPGSKIRVCVSQTPLYRLLLRATREFLRQKPRK